MPSKKGIDNVRLDNPSNPKKEKMKMTGSPKNTSSPEQEGREWVGNAARSIENNMMDISDIIPRDDSQEQSSASAKKTSQKGRSQLKRWNDRLEERGILDAAQQAGWSDLAWKGQPGWSIPLADDEGKPLTLPDGRPAIRWKNERSEPNEGENDFAKYYWGYADSRKGEAKPAGCDYYHVPGMSIRKAIAESNGILRLLCGEPDMLTLRAAGIMNVTSFFGEKNVPENLVDKLREWGVTTVSYYPDLDKTGKEAVEALATRLRYSGIALDICELPAEVNDKPIKDINDLYRALGCAPEAFRQYLVELPVTRFKNPPPTAGQKRGKASLPPAKRELPDDFYAAIEQALNVQEYQPNGWSKAIACPFKAHQHDDTKPAASYHQDMHILHCFKCGANWLAVEVGSVLGLNWRDFTKRTEKRPASQSKRAARKASGTETGSNEADGKLPPPTDDEFGDMLIADWSGNNAFFHSNWYEYQSGFWRPTEQVEASIWDVMRAHKLLGTKPNLSRVNSVHAYLKKKLAVPDDRIDQGSEYINLQNGLYNLETGQLEEHRPDLYLTSQLDYSHDPDADCPLWKQSLAQWLTTADGQPDDDLIALLQEAFGYSLTTDTSFEVAFWLYGPAGSGKSTVLRILAALGGSSQISLDLSSLDRNPYQLADLAGKRIVTCTEARAGSALVDHTLKALISGEELVGRQPFGRNFRFKSQAKVWWAMNERPTNRDSSNAIYRRLVNILFPNVVPPEKRNRRLLEQLLAELPGIFNWAMEGLKRLRENGYFTKSTQAEQSLEEYRLENDIERVFTLDTDWCIIDPGQQTKSEDLYLAYRAWCERFGHLYFKSQTKVARDWERLGLTKYKNGSVYYVGIGLTKPAQDAVKRLKLS